MRDTRVDLTLASGGRSSYLTYEPYYGLREKPFSLSADPRFFYKSRTHAPTFDELRAGIRRREGLIVLTGDIGTGKTTLCRSVLQALDRKTFCTMVPDPFVSREDLLTMLLIDFGVMSIDELKSGRFKGAARPELSYPLYEFLRSLVPLQAFAVLIIDEAQNLPAPLLEEIRILSDLEGPEKLLQVVLVGQLELREKLKGPAMRQVDQRVSVRCSLEALSRDAVASYVEHRLTVAGGGTDRVDFTGAAIDVLCDASGGNPRLINLIADRALHRGHLERTWLITPAVVAAAVNDLELGNPALAAHVASAVSLPDFPMTEAPATVASIAQPSTPMVSPLATPSPLAAPLKPSAEAAVPVEASGPAVEDLSSELSRIGDTLHLLAEHRPAPFTPPPFPDRRRWYKRLRRVGVAAAMIALFMAGRVVLVEWRSQAQELAQPLSMPSLPQSQPMRVGAGAAPVVPPADFSAPIVSQ
ncbi:MAG TPA: AAA family ATPase [Vicinamibacterales bacterium]|nr:AAA family ATPase [Vicinamibacterales bacterium]